MNLNSNTSKTERFLKAINQDADARCDKIRRDVDAYVEGELKKTRRLARQNVRPVRSSEFDRLNEEINTELSESETKEIEKLVERRDEITEKVFSRAGEKIEAFVKSEKYHDFILKSVADIRSAIGENCVIILRPADKDLETEIKALGSDVRYDEFIRLGGCKGENPETAMTADDTLDARLEAQKQEFYGRSGLSLSL